MSDAEFEARMQSKFDKMNGLPDELFVNVQIVDGIYGPGADGLYVCPDHNGRALPCRGCLYGEVATTPYVIWYEYSVRVLYDGLMEQTKEGSLYVSANPKHLTANATVDGELDLEALVDYLHERGFR